MAGSLTINTIIFNGDIVAGRKTVRHSGGREKTTYPNQQFDLINRDLERIRAVREIRSGRSVLLYGMSGIGKSHLAQDIAREVEQAFKDGVWFVSVKDLGIYGLCNAIARALDDESFPHLESKYKLERIRELLAVKSLLLFLDDIRSLSTFEKAVAMCPRSVTLLITSRYRFPGIRTAIAVEALSRQDAKRLFYQRSYQSAATSDSSAVEKVCEYWQDYPLGIVNSASRIFTEGLTAQSLAERYSRLKAQSGRRLPPEIRRVRASVSDQTKSLSSQQAYLLSLIAAAFSESIGLPLLALAAGRSEDETMDLAGGLIASSLVSYVNDRFTMHDTFRDAVLSGLTAQRLSLVRRQICIALLNLFGGRLEFEGDWYRGNIDALSFVNTETANIAGATEWAIAQDHKRLALSLFKFADIVLVTFGHYDAYIDLYHRLAKSAAHLSPLRMAWWKVTSIAYLLWQRGHFGEAKDAARSALATYRKRGNALGAAECELMLADVLMSEGHLDEADTLFMSCIPVFRKRRSQSNLARALGEYADFWNDSKHAPQGALPFCTESIELYTEMGDEEGIALGQLTLLDIRVALGQLAEAQVLLEDLRKKIRELGRPDLFPQLGWSEAIMREAIGLSYRKAGNKAMARDSLRAAFLLAKRANEAFTKLKMMDEASETQEEINKIRRESR